MRAMICQKVPMADGCNLAADVYLPDGPGPFPVLLTRTPYHRSSIGPARIYTENWGYAYVVQDTRGKYDSEGTFRPLVDEQADGIATVDWVANQKWCNGRIGMVGKSYLGIVQIPAASGGHEALKCIVPGVAPNSFFIDWIRYDGCFALANIIRWPMTHAVCPTNVPLAVKCQSAHSQSIQHESKPHPLGNLLLALVRACFLDEPSYLFTINGRRIRFRLFEPGSGGLLKFGHQLYSFVVR